MNIHTPKAAKFVLFERKKNAASRIATIMKVHIVYLHSQAVPRELMVLKCNVRKAQRGKGRCKEVFHSNVYQKIHVFKNNDFYFRLKVWIERCENEEVASQPLQLLCRSYYICSDHFCAKNFTGQNKKRLKAGVIPTVFIDKSEHDEEPGDDALQRDDHVEMACMSGTEREQHINNDGTLVCLNIISQECYFKKLEIAEG